MDRTIPAKTIQMLCVGHLLIKGNGPFVFCMWWVEVNKVLGLIK